MIAKVSDRRVSPISTIQNKPLCIPKQHSNTATQQHFSNTSTLQEFNMATKTLSSASSNVFSHLLDSDSDSDGESSPPSTFPLRGCPANINTHLQRIYGLFDFERELFPCSSCAPWMSMEDSGWDCPHVSLPYNKLFPSWAAASAQYHENHSSAECGGKCGAHPLMDDDMFVWQNSSLFNMTWGDLLLEQEEVYWNSLSAKQRTIILAERAEVDRRKAEESHRNSMDYQRILKEQAERQAEWESPEKVAARAAEKAQRKAEREARNTSSFSRWGSTTSSSSATEPRRASVSSLHHDETPAGGWGGCETSSSSSSAPAPAPRKVVRSTPTERHRGDGGLMPCKFHCWDNVWGRLKPAENYNGKSFAPGCSHTSCTYVHPDQPEWNDDLKGLFEKRVAAAASRPPRHNGPIRSGGGRR